MLRRGPPQACTVDVSGAFASQESSQETPRYWTDGPTPAGPKPQVTALRSTRRTPLRRSTRKGSEVQILYRPLRSTVGPPRTDFGVGALPRRVATLRDRFKRSEVQLEARYGEFETRRGESAPMDVAFRVVEADRRYAGALIS